MIRFYIKMVYCKEETILQNFPTSIKCIKFAPTFQGGKGSTGHTYFSRRGAHTQTSCLCKK